VSARAHPWLATTRATSLLALGAGVLLASSVVNPSGRPFVPVAFVFPGLMMVALEGASIRRAAWLGWLAGFGCNALAFYWIVGLLQTFAHFPLIAALPVAALLWAAQGLTLALAGAFAATARRAGAPLWIAFPLGALAAFGGSPALFPWNPSTSLVDWTAVAQVAELGGAALLDAVLLFGGAAAFEAMRRRRALPVAVAALALVGPWAFGLLRLPALEATLAEAPVLRVGVVQPNVGIRDKQDRRQAPRHLQQLRRVTVELERQGAEVVLWPETAYPYPMGRGMSYEPVGAYRMRAIGSRVPLLAGTITRGGECERWNSVVAVTPDGTIAGVADKVVLLHFGETVPGWHVLPPLRDYFRCPGLTAGDAAAVLPSAGARVGVLNCYEDVLPEATRNVAVLDPQWLANFTNDAWFGQTAEPHLHQLIARLRTIETRRELVRAVNTGVSSHVRADGTSAIETATFEEASFVAEVRLLEGVTPYTWLGDWVSPLAMGALLALLTLALISFRGRGGRGA
jgi:apolipoprotein N-acyltransferase